MPAGVPMRQYLTFMAASLLSMFVGSQVVHNYYHPLRDLNYYVEREIKMQSLREVLQPPDNTDSSKKG
ncbi:protein BRAWNIN [Anopheles marshallii]|uniref:protein BRAWNIN n=1 Tax=Anopheles marshallii TaxID=1521116 RepID=UPI00237BCB99|nr:protein BRAWNIN [Anopheles marshallii]